jgi:hypothetical protein
MRPLCYVTCIVRKIYCVPKGLPVLFRLNHWQDGYRTRSKHAAGIQSEEPSKPDKTRAQRHEAAALSSESHYRGTTPLPSITEPSWLLKAPSRCYFLSSSSDASFSGIQPRNSWKSLGYSSSESALGKISANLRLWANSSLACAVLTSDL